MKLSAVVFLIVTCVAGYFFGLSQGYFSEMATEWLAIILALTAIHFIVEPLRWHVYLGEGKRERWTVFYHVFLCTAFFSYVLPAKLGLPLRYWLITRHQHLPATTVGIYMAIDSALGLIVWALASVALGGNLVLWLLKKYVYVPELLVLALLAGIGALSLMFVLGLGRKPLRGWWNALRDGLSQAGLLVLARSVILLVLDIGAYVLRHAAILAALSAPFIGWRAIASATVLSIFAGFLCMLPMGLIGYDAVIVILLSQYGIPLEIAVMVPLINRSANLLLGVLLGVPSSLKLGLDMTGKSVGKLLNETRDEK